MLRRSRPVRRLAASRGRQLVITGQDGAVNVDDAREIVEAAQVEPTYSSFDGERHEALCILAEGAEWKVFLSERGSRYEERAFANEDRACVWFLRRLFQLSQWA